MKKNFIYIILLLTIFNGSIFCENEISLDGEWLFKADSNVAYNVSNIDSINSWLKVDVPSSWHLYSKEMLDYQGIGWFKKTFDIQKIDESKRYLIKFDAVDYFCEVFVNKKFVGKHEGGYTPFSFEITKYLNEGNNDLILRINDPTDTKEGTEGISYRHIPHGKQNWYVQTSGIWQSVNLFIKEKDFIESLKVTPQNSGEFSISININHSITSDRSDLLYLRMLSPDNKTVYTENFVVDSSNAILIESKLIDPQLWNINNPHLYKIIAQYGKDHFEEKFGFREFTKKNGKFYLNKKPFYMISALDQNFYPETIYKSPGKNYIRDEMKKAIELGINTMRCHIKIPEKEYLEVADELGLLVWYEIPNWDVFNDSVKARARFTFNEMLNRDWNHPSLVIISLINESWGIDLSKDAQRKWLIDEFDYAKEKAVGRLIVDNSACYGNFHLKTDINDYHIYWAIPENHKKFSDQVKEINQRPKWLYSNFGDAQETGNEVLMISEFGNWGLPKLPQELPFWFNRPLYDDWITLPAGVEKRFLDFRYDRIFKNYDGLAEVSQIAQAKSLKYEIEEIRLANAIQGYCVTEFTDINWEVNGLLDMWRNYKMNKEVLQMIQQPDVIIPQSSKYNYFSGEEIKIEIFLSYFSGKDLSNVKLKWKVKNHSEGEFRINKNIMIGEVKKMGGFYFDIDNVSKPQNIRVELELISDTGIIANNYLDVFVFPRDQKIITKENIIVTSKIDNEILNEVEKGKSVLCIADSSNALPDSFPYQIVSRESDWLDGNWATSLNWFDPGHPVFNGLNFGKSFGFEASGVLPNYVINQVPHEKFDSVPAGLFIGWLYLNSAYIIESKYGKGKLIITTFDLLNDNDPYSVKLYNNLIEYISSNTFQPNNQLKLNAGKINE